MNDEKVGVLGVMKDERSQSDQKLLKQYGCSSENYIGLSAGVTEIPAEYRYGWEERSIKDKMMLAEFGTCKTNCNGSTGPEGLWILLKKN
jgi:hypothetical protein